MIKLTVLSDTEAGKEFTLEADSIVIGRSSACDVALSDRALSRRHCSITRRETDYVVTDLDSGNGTFVNDDETRVTTQTLKNGDEISIGKTRLRVEIVHPARASGTSTGLHTTEVAAAPPATFVEQAPPLAGLNAVQPPEFPIVVTVVSGADRGMVYSPAREVFTIGRAQTCDIVLNDNRISRLHASIKRETGKYRLYDENSINGTFLRTPQDRVFYTDLADGDIIYLGQTQLRVEIRSDSQIAFQAPTDDATVVTGSVAGKTFVFNLRALGKSPRLTQQTDLVAGAPQEQGDGAEEVTRFVPLVAANSPQITLRVVEGADKGTVFTPDAKAGQFTFTVGRGDKADFRLEDKGISRIHFTVEITSSGIFLNDSESLNGTFLDQRTERINRVELQGGETIRLGATLLKAEVVYPEGVQIPESVGAIESSQPLDATSVLVPQTQRQVEEVRSRSAAFKDRLAAIARQKDITLKPFTMPGSPRQWATLLLMLLAATVSYGFFLVGHPEPYTSGPLAEDHAKWESKCTTCHPSWGIQPVNATCGATQECHADVLKVRENVRDNCVSCHTEHRGRAFPINGGEAQCWGCHKAGLGVRAFDARPMKSYYQQVYVLAEALVPRPGKVTNPANIKPVALVTARESWLRGSGGTPTGLKYGHAIHSDDVKRENKKQEECIDCHVKLPDGGVALFPTHAECIACHTEVVDRDPQVAAKQASEQCLKCHTQKKGGVTRITRARNFVDFEHGDHESVRCVQCHAVVTGEHEYRPVQRSAVAYPVPMDACYSCHQNKKATLACLDCHREHHSYPSGIEVAGGWLSAVPFSGVLLLIVGLVAGAGAYTYVNVQVVRRWLLSREVTLAADEASSGATGARGAAPLADAGAASASAPPPPAGDGGVMPYPVVDAATCISCSSCYDSCPTNVLAGDLVTHKSTVVNSKACTAQSNGCTICQDGCPTGAIRVTTAPLVKEVERPEMDQHNESNIPGIFLVGEVVGAALIKKAVNQGDQAIRYIRSRKPRIPHAPYDVIVVGAGPSGLAAGLEAKRFGLRYLVLERETVASTIQNYPRDKAVLAEPVLLSIYGLLPMMDAKKEQLVTLWEDVVRTSGLQVNTREEVTKVEKADDLFTVTTTKGAYQGAYVIFATGTRGNPRKLGVPGEDLPKVTYNLVDAAEWQGKQVLVVGGGDSAIEAAVALSQEPETMVTLSYRRGEFSRVKPRNLQAIEEQAKAGRLTLLLNSQLAEVTEHHVKIKLADGLREFENDAIFALIGADPPRAWLEKIGVRFVVVKETVGGQW